MNKEEFSTAICAASVPLVEPEDITIERVEFARQAMLKATEQLKSLPVGYKMNQATYDKLRAVYQVHPMPMFSFAAIPITVDNELPDNKVEPVFQEGIVA